MKCKIFCIIIIIMVFILCPLAGCVDGNKYETDDPIKDFYGAYQLMQLKYGYYDAGGIHRAGWMELPIDSPNFGSIEQNEFYCEALNLLGEELTFATDYILFSGVYADATPYTYFALGRDIYLNFDNVFGTQDGEIKKYINFASTTVWRDFHTNTVTSRVIRIDCYILVPGQGPLDFQPVAVFEFEYFKFYS